MKARGLLKVRGSAGSGWRPRAGSGKRGRRPERGLRFPLGRIAVTPGALAALERVGDSPLRFLARHATGDRGDLDEHDCEASERAVTMGERMLSEYVLRSGERLWIVTEADRSATTLLLPCEY